MKNIDTLKNDDYLDIYEKDKGAKGVFDSKSPQSARNSNGDTMSFNDPSEDSLALLQNEENDLGNISFAKDAEISNNILQFRQTPVRPKGNGGNIEEDVKNEPKGRIDLDHQDKLRPLRLPVFKT